MRNAGQFLQLLECLSTLPFITLLWLQLHLVVIMLITGMPWLIMVFDVIMTLDMGFPAFKCFLHSEAVLNYGLFLLSSPGSSLAEGE